ncbi:acyltransferase family protein, partial [Salibacteraceae bacterium]|nr:acyltransferase family protein [Salibacteraceae bacterium]
LLLPNYAYVLFSGVPFFLHAWSIGVEEQFYVFWPLLFKRKMNWLLVTTVILVFLTGFDLINSFGEHYWPQVYDLIGIKSWQSFNIEPMLWGAWVYFVVKQGYLGIKTWIKSKWLTLLLSLTLISIFFSGFWMPLFHFQFMSLLIGLLLANLSYTNLNYRFLENKLIKHLGNISYGIYMIHPFVIIILIQVFEIENRLIIYGIGLSLTLLLSSISYEKFEKKFLDLKRNF